MTQGPRGATGATGIRMTLKLLFFKAPWCAACHAIENDVPTYCIHVDCDKDQVTPALYNVVGLPMFVAVDPQNKEVARIQTTNVSMLDKWFKGLQEEANIDPSTNTGWAIYGGV